jgi:uncharacterized membrane protein YgcG
MPVSTLAEERSFSIDKVEIRGWIFPDGDLVVEEMFTYTFDGNFNGVTRVVHRDGHEGLEFFEAYLPSENAEIGFIKENQLQSLHVENQDGTYRIHSKSENETKRFLYRYRLDGAIKTYEEYSEVLMTFFDETLQQNLHNVTIDLVFPEPVSKNDYHAFSHDRNGSITFSSKEMVRFETPVIAEGTTTELRLLFPSNVMTESELIKAEVPLQQIVQEEEKLQDRYEGREDKLQSLEPFLKGISLTAVILAILLLLFLPQNIRRWDRQTVSLEDVVKMDPVLLYHIYHKGNWKKDAFLAGLFSLVDRGHARIEKVKANKSFLADKKAPDETIKFILKTSFKNLKREDQELVDWLFTKHARRFVTLDMVSGPTETEKKEKKNLKKYRDRYLRFQTGIKEWKQKSTESDLLQKTVKANRWLRWLTLCIVLFLQIIILYSFYYDVHTGLGMGVAAVSMTISGLFAVMKEKKGRFFYLFLFISCFVSAQMEHTGVSNFLLITVIPAFAFLQWSIPRDVMNAKTAAYYYAIRRFKKALKKGNFSDRISSEQLDTLMKSAILLGIERPFRKQIKEKFAHSELLTSLPLVSFSVDPISPVQYTTKSISNASSSDSSYGGSSSSGGGGSGGGGGDAGAF